jgi:hypothetical protein
MARVCSTKGVEIAAIEQVDIALETASTMNPMASIVKSLAKYDFALKMERQRNI